MASFDPLASSQVTVDPALKPKPSRELAVRRQQLIEMFMNQGMDETQATQAADQYLADYPVATGQQVAGPAAPAPAAPVSPRDAMEADLYGKGYSADEARKQADMQAEMQAEREAKQLELDLSQGGYGQRRVPGPRDLSGRAPMGAPFASVKEGQDYSARAVDEDGLTQESQKDADMRARGYAPVIGPDGSVSYMVGYNPGFIGGPGRPGARPDLAGKYEVVPRPGLNDKEEMVYAPTAEFRQQMVEQNARVKEAQDRRNPYKDLPSPAERMKRFQAQIQLGGGHLSPQAIQLETLLNGMDPEQRQRAMQYMAPGGALAAQVDARNLEAAAGLARNAVVGVLGQQGPGNPLVDLQVQQGRQEMRAGIEDGMGESYAPAPMLGGIFGRDDFTIGEQQQMYDDLIAVHGYTEEEARAAVDAQARKRGARQRLFGAEAAPQAQGAPAEPDVEPRPGVGTPGNKPRGGKGDGGKRTPADPPKDRPSNQTGRGASRKRNRPGDARPRE